MIDRVKELINQLQLLPHPEGGYYKETYRSPQSVNTEPGPRNLCTVIYFLLTSENISKFHRIKSDEHWFWHEGDSLTIHLLSEKGHEKIGLGPVDSLGNFPQQVVKANTIFGSTVDTKDSYALVSCVVAPGFDFEDFELFDADTLLKSFPENESIIKRLT